MAASEKSGPSSRNGGIRKISGRLGPRLRTAPARALCIPRPCSHRITELAPPPGTASSIALHRPWPLQALCRRGSGRMGVRTPLLPLPHDAGHGRKPIAQFHGLNHLQSRTTIPLPHKPVLFGMATDHSQPRDCCWFWFPIFIDQRRANCFRKPAPRKFPPDRRSMDGRSSRHRQCSAVSANEGNAAEPGGPRLCLCPGSLYIIGHRPVAICEIHQ